MSRTGIRTFSTRQGLSGPIQSNVRTAAAIFLILLAVSCSSSNPSAPSTSNGQCMQVGSLTAQVDGVLWTAACVQGVNDRPTLSKFTVTGFSRDFTEGLSLTIVATEPGDYSLGGPTPPPEPYPYSTAVLTRNCQPHPGSCLAWFVSPCCGQRDGNGSGNVTVTHLSPTGVSGSFSLDLVPNSSTGASGVKAVRNGVFTAMF
jgi:Family of unknown function (DUF6252)